jgi:hypothetical protein
MSNDGFQGSDFERNPYAPADVGYQVPGQSVNLPPGQRRGFVGHVTALGILMIVQGALDLAAGVIAGIYSWYMPEFFAAMAKQGAKNGGKPTPGFPPEFEFYFVIGAAIFATILVLIGLLLIYSGIGVIRFQRRTLAITSLLLGVLTLATCYCFPTSLLLGIYGLIVLFSQSVSLAFHLRREGYTSRDIQLAFLSPPAPLSDPLDF